MGFFFFTFIKYTIFIYGLGLDWRGYVVRVAMVKLLGLPWLYYEGCCGRVVRVAVLIL